MTLPRSNDTGLCDNLHVRRVSPPSLSSYLGLSLLRRRKSSGVKMRTG